MPWSTPRRDIYIQIKGQTDRLAVSHQWIKVSFHPDLWVCDCSYLSSSFPLFFLVSHMCAISRSARLRAAVLGPSGTEVFLLCWCEDRYHAVCLRAKINSNVKWQSESLRIGACCLPPPSPLTIALRSMALPFTHCIPVHYTKNRCMCVSLIVQFVSRYFPTTKW